ncbi:conjugal transfer protein TraA, partial [Escherichia coli]|nr:conjugal transfer protein TraA [Escherichia coli]
LEGYDALRSAVLMRTFVFMISNTAKENEKM